MKKITVVTLGILAILLAKGAPRIGAEPKVAPIVTTVSGLGFVADFYSSPGSEKKIGILALGGSAGGKPSDWAASFAAAGHPVLAVGYFKVNGRPDTLEEIDLEYFDKPIDWLMAGNRAKPGGIVVAGISKGAELALLLASRKSEITGVIALAPSSVVWQGVPKAFWPPPPARSSWSAGGQPVPFVPYDNKTKPNMGRMDEYYRRSLVYADEASRAAAIPVEKINGPILLLSGAEDRIWPSAEMGEAIAARLKEKGFKHGFTHVIFPDAGHMLRDGFPLGGTSEGNVKAGIEYPKRISEFLEKLDQGRSKP